MNRLVSWVKAHERIHAFIHSTWCRALSSIDKRRAVSTSGTIINPPEPSPAPPAPQPSPTDPAFLSAVESEVQRMFDIDYKTLVKPTGFAKGMAKFAHPDRPNRTDPLFWQHGSFYYFYDELVSQLQVMGWSMELIGQLANSRVYLTWKQPSQDWFDWWNSL